MKVSIFWNDSVNERSKDFLDFSVTLPCTVVHDVQSIDTEFNILTLEIGNDFPSVHMSYVKFIKVEQES